MQTKFADICFKNKNILIKNIKSTFFVIVTKGNERFKKTNVNHMMIIDITGIPQITGVLVIRSDIIKISRETKEDVKGRIAT